MQARSWQLSDTLPKKPRDTVRSMLVKLLGAALFWGFAAFVTWMAPTSTLVLERGDDSIITAHLTEYVLWFIPSRRLTLRDVRDARAMSVTPTPSDSWQSSTQGTTPESIDYLVLQGEGGELRAMVSHEGWFEVVRTIRRFLSGGERSLRVDVVANWLIAVMVPGIVALPGVLLLVGFAWDAISLLRRRR